MEASLETPATRLHKRHLIRVSGNENASMEILQLLRKTRNKAVRSRTEIETLASLLDIQSGTWNTIYPLFAIFPYLHRRGVKI